MLPSILSTKLFIPEIRENHIVRKSLVEKLRNGIKSGNKLTLVSAPAGYGKTTLILELLRSVDITAAWISLDDGENDITQFFCYLTAALKKAGVAIEGSTEEIARDFTLSSTNTPSTMIINDISVHHSKVVLVLDDFHFIHAAQVNDAVNFLIDHQPPNLHLIIITREDPLLPLARLRAQSKITEIRFEDLRFSRDEAAAFFSKVMDLKLDSEEAGAIADRTEGWIAGLQLAGLSLYGCKEQDIGEFIKVLRETNQYIIDYLVEEVINRQPAEVREFLCKTSVLDRMNGGLCDAVMDRDDSSRTLRELNRINLFLIPLDSKRDWYRYHHLFADSLRKELSKEEERQVHHKAALWLEDNGFLQEAVEHAFKSGDMLLALRLVENNTEQAFNKGQLTTFVKWLKMLPEELVRSSEVLSVRKAFALLMAGKGSETHEYLGSLGKDFFEKATPHNKGMLLCIGAVMAQYSGQGDAEKQANEAMRFLEPWDTSMRIAALNTLGRAQEDKGKFADAIKTLRMTYNESRKLGYSFLTTLTLMNLGTSLNGMGSRLEATLLFEQYIDGMIAEYGKPLPYIGIIYVGMAGLCYENNELEKARSYMDEGSQLCQSIFYNWIENKGIIESRIQFAFGEIEAAIDTIKKSIDAISNHDISEIRILNTAALAEFLLRSGDIEQAKLYGEKLKGYMESKSIACREAYLPYARLLIYEERDEEALALLRGMEPQIEETHKGKDIITFYILYSKVHYAAKDYQKAGFCFEKAVSIAEPQGYLRLFLDEELIIKDIICFGKIAGGAFVSKLAEIMKAPPLPVPGSTDKTAESERKKADQYVEKMSRRETEILDLLAKGMSNDEIAKKLYISVNTTQWHISHIYSKLGVRSRTQAILRAKELEIL